MDLLVGRFLGHYDTQNNDIELNDTQHKGLISLSLNDVQYNNTLSSAIMLS